MKIVHLGVDVHRGKAVESTHSIRGVVCPATGDRVAGHPDSGFPTFWRSAMKPFQALPLIADGAAQAFGFGPAEIALCCASHGGMRQHTEGVARMLRRIGLSEGDLHCGPHPPFDRDSAQVLSCAGRLPGRLHNNCSGKHVGMLALALHHGWPTDGYEGLGHPVQRRIRAGLGEWMDDEPDDHQWSLDGCGVPTPRMPLHEMARAYSRLVRRAREGHAAALAVVGSMTGRPDLTSSPGRVPLQIMESTHGRLLAKEGAEGVLCMAAIDGDWGLALKVEDGSVRAVGPAAVAMLQASGLATREELEALESLRRPEILNTLGARVGVLQVRWLESRGAGP